MTRISPPALVMLAHNAGWSGGDVLTAVAVALAASGGNTGRTGGIWGLPGTPPTLTPETDAAAAHATQAAKGWDAFPKYRNNAYKLQIPMATAAIATAGTTAVITEPGKVIGALAESAGSLPGSDMIDTLKSAVAPLYKAGAWLSNQANMLRVAYVVFGGAIIVGSLVMIAGPGALGGVASSVVKPILKKVGK